MNYYDIKVAPDGLPFLSNSYLSACKRNNQDITQEMTKNFLFGRVFHQFLLEPHKKKEKIAEIQDELILHMVNACWNQYGFMFFFDVRNRIEHEIYRKWMGRWWKGKVDIDQRPQKVIVDFKTTSAFTYSVFQQSIDEYDYDRQGAVYLALCPWAECFQLIGVTKKPNPNFYEYEISRNSPVHKKGLEKVKDLQSKVYDYEKNILAMY
jgi:hypothetical protein